MKKRPHTEMDNTAMPKTGRQLGNFPRAPGMPYEAGGRKIAGTPAQPSGEVGTQRGGGGGASPFPHDVFERGRQPVDRGPGRRPPGGSPPGQSMRNTDMPRVGRMSATAPGELARPGYERTSATMDARSSVPVSIQEASGGSGDTRDRFSSLDYGKTRYDNAEIDDGTGTGRRVSGTFRGNRRV
jgi:hypothetical protein